MQNIFNVVYAVLIFNMLRGYSVTVHREREVVAEGGSPLPTSSYVFLVLEFIIKVILTSTILKPIMTHFILASAVSHAPSMIIILVAVLLLIIQDLVTRFLLTVIKTLMIRYIVQRTAKNMKD